MYRSLTWLKLSLSGPKLLKIRWHICCWLVVIICGNKMFSVQQQPSSLCLQEAGCVRSLRALSRSRGRARPWQIRASRRSAPWRSCWGSTTCEPSSCRFPTSAPTPPLRLSPTPQRKHLPPPLQTRPPSPWRPPPRPERYQVTQGTSPSRPNQEPRAQSDFSLFSPTVNRTWFIICTLCLAPVYFPCTLMRLW